MIPPSYTFYYFILLFFAFFIILIIEKTSVKVFIDFIKTIDRIILMVHKDLLTKKETMEYLRISASTIEKLMKSGELPYIKFERKVLFRKSNIDKFLEKKTVN